MVFKALAVVAFLLSLWAVFSPAFALQLGSDRCPEMCSHGDRGGEPAPEKDSEPDTGDSGDSDSGDSGAEGGGDAE